MRRDWRTAQRREKAWRTIGTVASYLAAAVVLTMPMWLVLLGVV